MGADPYGPALTARYAPGPGPPGDLGRADRRPLEARPRGASTSSRPRSQRLAAAADLQPEIVPITVPGADGTEARCRSPTRRSGRRRRVERLAALKPAFESDEMAERFPEINWSVTAGNSSQLTDGASARS